MLVRYVKTGVCCLWNMVCIITVSMYVNTLLSIKTLDTMVNVLRYCRLRIEYGI